MQSLNTCAAGYTKCRGDLSAANTNYNANCGGSGNVCRNGQYCVGGVCTPFPCPTGQIRCGTQCVSTINNLANCGRCENVCKPGADCLNGVCTPIVSLEMYLV